MGKEIGGGKITKNTDVLGGIMLTAFGAVFTLIILSVMASGKRALGGNPHFMLWVALAIGAFLFLGGVLIFIDMAKTHFNKLELLRKRNIAYAEFDRVETYGSSYCVYCKQSGGGAGAERSFCSESLRFHPGKLIEEHGIKAFPVYTDLWDSGRYHLSVEPIAEILRRHKIVVLR